MIVMMAAAVVFLGCSRLPHAAAPPSSAEAGALEETAPPGPRFQILVFSPPADPHHASTPQARRAVQRLGEQHDFAVDTTGSAQVFTPDRLRRYDAVVFLNTAGDLLNEQQRQAFERYIRAGGGFVGMHAAAGAVHDWPWYGNLVGTHRADSTAHPDVGWATLQVVDRVHPSTAPLPERWRLADAWYDYAENPRGSVHVLATADTSRAGAPGSDLPVAWAQDYDGGRSWYTGLGHTAELYADRFFLEHLLGGITWAAGAVEADVGATVAGSFEKVVLVDRTTRPNVLEVAGDGRVFFAEREGAIRVWDPQSGATSMVGFVPTDAVHTSGLLGMALDPDFESNGWIYLYYAPYDPTRNELARFTVQDGRLLPGSKKVLLEVPVQRHVDGGHSAGALAFGPDGNLYLSTGDNTNPRGTGFAPIDERPGREARDAQRSSANTFDLRGKILRIRPLPEGTYSIPEGNLFPYGSRGRPEIYIMGARNPFRFSIDPETGRLFWGDVGPDAGAPQEELGPQGYDEFNAAIQAGNYGWPYFVADNRAYHDYDFEAEEAGPPFDPKVPINDSPNNTGARVLPPAQPALIWYPYGPSEAFPELGSGGRAAMAGPLYRYDQEAAGAGGLPAYFDGALFVFDFMRNWIKEVRLDAGGRVLKINPFLPEMTFHRPIDMEVGPDGMLYVIEWGSDYEGWYNDDARIVRLAYRGTQGRAPEGVEADSVEEGGAIAETAGPARSDPSAPHFAWPVQGGFFSYDRPVAYRVVVPGRERVEREQVVVQPLLVHDTHTHALAPQVGAEGTFQVLPDESHLYLEDYVLQLEVRYFDEVSPDGVQVLAGQHRIVLQPRRKQAEHAASAYRVERRVSGDDRGGSVLRVRRRVHVALALKDSSYVSYAPVSLHGIEALTFRMAPASGGVLEVRLDARDGPLIAEVRLDPAAAAPEGAEDEGPRVGPWTERTVPVQAAAGPRELFLVARGQGDEPLLLLDWIEFDGPGGTVPPSEPAPEAAQTQHASPR